MSASRPAAAPSSGPTTDCPGCGAVLARVTDVAGVHPGASASCTRLFEVTLRGIREEAAADPAAATAVRLADAAYDAQHPDVSHPGRLQSAVDSIAGELGATAPRVTPERRPPAWRTTIADVAADLDVIDLPVLVESWARAVLTDWS